MRDLSLEIKGLVPDTVSIRLRADLKISEDIDGEVDTAAVNFGYYAVLAEKADTRYQKMKFSFEAWQADKESRALRLREMESLKPFTEAQMKAHIKSQPKYRGFALELIELDEQRRILKIISKAFEMKMSLVQTKSSNRRTEIRTPSGK